MSALHCPAQYDGAMMRENPYPIRNLSCRRTESSVDPVAKEFIWASIIPSLNLCRVHKFGSNLPINVSSFISV